ncbi:MAG: fatty acyl-AMP ligase [Symploca sp. SIO1B1]|nr:fatty acyl-AMP ligase [Symploca sp. SIO1B1]
MIQCNFNQVIANLKSSDTALYFWEASQVTSVDYSQLRSLIIGNAEHFRALGVSRGTRVVICLKTDVEHIVSFLAFIAIGAVPISIKPAKTINDVYIRDLAKLCSKFNIQYGYHTLPLPSGLVSLVWRSSASSTNLAAIAEVEPNDLVFVQFSSGSTSAPKAIPISHKNLMTNLSAILAVDGREPGSKGFNFLPLSHDMGLVGGLLSNLVYQNSLLLTGSAQFLRRPVDALIIANELNVNVMAMPDFALSYISKYLSVSRNKRLHKNVLSNLRTIYCGAEPIRFNSIKSFLEIANLFGLDPSALFFCYGLAEGTLLVTGRRFNTIQDSFDMSLPNRITARLGPPLGRAEVRICNKNVNAKENIVEEGQIGSVQIRGSNVFNGYWEDIPVSENDWFSTGDIGFIRNGELHICGRDKDMIIVNGENIFAVDIENSLAAIPELRETLVMVDEEQFYVLAVTSSKINLDTKKISSFICQNFGVVPQQVIPGLPGHILRTTSGKPMRRETLSRLKDNGVLTI